MATNDENFIVLVFRILKDCIRCAGLIYDRISIIAFLN